MSAQRTQEVIALEFDGMPTPIVAPRDVVIDGVLDVIAKHTFGIEDEADILMPNGATTATDAHDHALLFLEQHTNAEYGVMRDEFGYTDTLELSEAISWSSERAETDYNFNSRYQILSTRLNLYFRNWSREQAGLTKHEPVVEVVAVQPVEVIAPQPPSLSPEDRELFTRYREEDTAAVKAVDARYEDIVLAAVEALGDTAPAETMDTAWAVLDNRVRTVDLNSPVDFDTSLATALETELASAMEFYEIVETTKTLDMHKYYGQLTKYEAALGKRVIKPSLDRTRLEAIVSRAQDYVQARFARHEAEPIADFAKTNSGARGHIMRSFANTYSQVVAKRVKTSAHMVSQGEADFHLAQLPEDKVDAFLALTFADVAEAEIGNKTRHKQQR